MDNDSMSSIMVPYGTSVELFENRDFSGEKVTMVGKQFVNDNQEMECINIKDIKSDFEDELSSLRVYKTGGGLSVGQWT